MNCRFADRRIISLRGLGIIPHEPQAAQPLAHLQLGPSQMHRGKWEQRFVSLWKSAEVDE
jgi:hypothetical protein